MSAKRAGDSGQHLRCSKGPEETENSTSSRSKNGQGEGRELTKGVKELSICSDKRSSPHRPVPSVNQPSENHRPALTSTCSHGQHPSRTAAAPYQLPTKPVKGNPRITTSADAQSSTSKPSGSKRLRVSPSYAPLQNPSRGERKKGPERGRNGSPPTPSSSDATPKPKPSLTSHPESYSLQLLIYHRPRIPNSWELYFHRAGEDQVLSRIAGGPLDFVYEEKRGVAPNTDGFVADMFLSYIALEHRDLYLQVVRSEHWIQSLILEEHSPHWCRDILMDLWNHNVVPDPLDFHGIFPDTRGAPWGPHDERPLDQRGRLSIQRWSRRR